MKHKVLVADDHEMVRFGVRSVLEQSDDLVVCAEAGDGLEAILKTRELLPDVIILDPGMPKLNGISAARRIMWENPQQRIILFSTIDSEPMLRIALAAGVKGFVLKSDPLSDLLEAVKALLQDRPFFSSKASEMILEGYLHEDQRELRQNAKNGNRALTMRELEIAQLLAEGKCSKEIATILGLSVKTAETHRHNLMSKLHVHSLAPLVLYTIQNNIIEVPVFDIAPEGNSLKAAAA